jgi:hypothetical protein
MTMGYWRMIMSEESDSFARHSKPYPYIEVPIDANETASVQLQELAKTRPADRLVVAVGGQGQPPGHFPSKK